MPASDFFLQKSSCRQIQQGRKDAVTRRRMCCATQQHLFLVSFSLTETDSLVSFPPHAASNKNKTLSDIQKQHGGDTCPFCVHVDGFSHTKSLKTKVWISSVNFGYNRLFSIPKSHFFHTIRFLKSESFSHLKNSKNSRRKSTMYRPHYRARRVCISLTLVVRQ